jgi:AAA+ superfamily predicted ATPase
MDDNLNDFGTKPKKRANAYTEEQTDQVCKESSEEEKKDLVGFTQWSYIDKDVFSPTRTTKATLESGYYTIFSDSKGYIYYKKKHLETDEILDFKEGISKKIVKDIQDFWDLADNFKKYNFVHRRGYLLYGEAGSGKTMIVNLIVKDVIERGGVVITSSETSLYSVATERLREIEPNRKIVCIFEDIDTMVERKHNEDDILRFLDGDNQIGNILNIATTNYPESLDKRIVARPRRFDRVIKVTSPSREVRKEYLQKKLNITDEELEIWAEATEGFSFAALADLVISVKCLNNDFKNSVEKIKSLCDAKYSSDEYYHKRAGFDS